MHPTRARPPHEPLHSRISKSTWSGKSGGEMKWEGKERMVAGDAARVCRPGMLLYQSWGWAIVWSSLLHFVGYLVPIRPNDMAVQPSQLEDVALNLTSALRDLVPHCSKYL